MVGGPRAQATGFRLKSLEKPEEFRGAEEIERQALGAEAALALPAPLLRTLRDNGGLVLGAFVDIYLAGVAVSSLGWDGRTLFQHSHLTVVRPEYQYHRVGLRLKAFQRDEVLAQGLTEVRWTFDPLSSRAARLGVHRLGAVPDRYLANYYGRLSEGTGSDPETDRLHVRWVLTDPEVERRVGAPSPPPEEVHRSWRERAAIVETEQGEHGLRIPQAVVEPERSAVHLEVPYDIASLRQHDPSAARRWRHAVRDAFRIVFDLGYSVDDFIVLSLEHERRCFYLASPRKADVPEATSPSSPA